MPILLRNITLGLDEPEEALVDRAAKRLRVRREDIRRCAPVRRALDARRGRQICFVYNLEVSLVQEAAGEAACVRRLRGRNVELVKPDKRDPLEPGDQTLPHRPVIVGFGPAGMFAALRLAQYGYQPVVLERGRDVRRRHKDVLHTFYRNGVLNPESNLLFGEGGAGTYSDGKVYTRLSDPMVREVLATFVRFGADPDILIDSKPHIGSDRIATISRRIGEHVRQCGGEIRFDTRVDDFEVSDGRLCALTVGTQRVATGPVLLGIGHSARDTFERLMARGVRIDAKPFQFGVRIEHTQETVDRWQYGDIAGHRRLGPADYRLVAKGAAGQAGDLFSFCMCPGGTILPAFESPDVVATNGGSRASRKSPFANSGFVVTVDPSQIGSDPLAGLAFQRKWERRAFQAAGGGYKIPLQRCSDFLAGRSSDGSVRTSYPFGGRWCRLRDSLPEPIAAALTLGLGMLDEKLPGFAGPEGIIAAPESRASSPIRIARDPATRQSLSTAELYPIGEGAGYAGGIVSAAIDGIRSAETIIRIYKPID